MAEADPTTLTVRIRPAAIASWSTSVERERRRLANMVQVILRNPCARERVEIAEPAPETPEASATNCTNPQVAPADKNNHTHTAREQPA